MWGDSLLNLSKHPICSKMPAKELFCLRNIVINRLPRISFKKFPNSLLLKASRRQTQQCYVKTGSVSDQNYKSLDEEKRFSLCVFQTNSFQTVTNIGESVKVISRDIIHYNNICLYVSYGKCIPREYSRIAVNRFLKLAESKYSKNATALTTNSRFSSVV